MCVISGCVSNAVKIPNLHNYDLASAKTVLSDLGLTPFVIEQHSQTIEAGWVIKTNPKAGSDTEPNSGIEVFVSKGPKPTLFDNAFAACHEPFGVSVSDKGTTISIDTRGNEETTGASNSDLLCIIKALETPDYIYKGIMSVRALDGRQTQNFDNLTIWYSYHPDSGATVVFHVMDKPTD